MKISDVMRNLKAIKKEHGNIDVFMEIEETSIESVCGEVHGLKMGKSFMQLRNGVYLTNVQTIKQQDEK